jgi:hypothetical protein
MAKANANTVSDQYAEEGTQVTRAVGDVKEVIVGDGPNADPIDKNVQGQTPSELKKVGQDTDGGKIHKPNEVKVHGDDIREEQDDDAPDEQTGKTVETAPGGGVTADRARGIANEEKGGSSSRGSNSGRSSTSSASATDKSKTSGR